MAPSENAINTAIKKTITDMWFGPEREQLSVNNVRAQVEKQLKLEDGFLKTGTWKDKSKAIIKTDSQKYIDAEEAGAPLSRPEPTPSPSPAKAKPAPAKKEKKAEPVKKGTKRASNGGEKTQPRKRQKKAATPSDEDDSESALTSADDTAEESELSDVSEDSDAPKSKKAKKPITKSAPKSKQKKIERGDEDESELSELKDEEFDKPNSKSQINGNDSDSDMSVLIDEPPKPRKSKSTPSEKSAKPKAVSKAKTPADLSPDDAEIKTLQSQLQKCGIRKIWGIELKKYDDSKSKIRHLKGMLRDAGMDGRFSEARAREIKEARELKEDLEAVQEGEKQWGMGRGARSKKTQKKTMESADEEEEEDEEEDAPPPRIPRAKMDLAFLGDEESDSD